MSSVIERLMYAVEDYQEEFGNAPTTFGLDPDLMPKAIDLLEAALDAGEPISEADFLKGLGVEPDDPDDII